LSHQLRRDAHHLLAVSDQQTLHAPGDVTAVLDRPHTPLVRKLVRPAPRAQHPLGIRMHRTRRDDPAGSRIHRGERMRALVGVRANHHHVLVPSSNEPVEADLRRTHLSRGDATLLSSHAGDPRTAVSDTTLGGQALWPTSALGVSSPPAEEPEPPVGRHRARHQL
jgi:hypothetical protein